jgi:hypothetical protein
VATVVNFDLYSSEEEALTCERVSQRESCGHGGFLAGQVFLCKHVLFRYKGLYPAPLSITEEAKSVSLVVVRSFQKEKNAAGTEKQLDQGSYR